MVLEPEDVLLALYEAARRAAADKIDAGSATAAGGDSVHKFDVGIVGTRSTGDTIKQQQEQVEQEEDTKDAVRSSRINSNSKEERVSRGARKLMAFFKQRLRIAGLGFSCSSCGLLPANDRITNPHRTATYVPTAPNENSSPRRSSGSVVHLVDQRSESFALSIRLPLLLLGCCAQCVLLV
jgi:hypothetical protein